MKNEPALTLSGLAGAFLAALANLTILEVLDLVNGAATAALIVADAGIALVVALLVRAGVDSPATVERKVADAVEHGKNETLKLVQLAQAVETPHAPAVPALTMEDARARIKATRPNLADSTVDDLAAALVAA